METTSIPTGVYSYTRHHTEQHRSSLGRARPLQKSEDTRYQGHEERTAQGEPGGGWGLREGKGAGEERWTVEAAGWPGAARGTTTGYGGEQSPEVRAGRGPAAGTDTAPRVQPAWVCTTHPVLGNRLTSTATQTRLPSRDANSTLLMAHFRRQKEQVTINTR